MHSTWERNVWAITELAEKFGIQNLLEFFLLTEEAIYSSLSLKVLAMEFASQKDANFSQNATFTSSRSKRIEPPDRQKQNTRIVWEGIAWEDFRYSEKRRETLSFCIGRRLGIVMDLLWPIPKKDMLKFEASVPQNVIIFGNWVFIEVIKIKWSC